MTLSREELCQAVSDRLSYLAFTLQARTVARFKDASDVLDPVLGMLFNAVFDGEFVSLSAAGQGHHGSQAADWGDRRQHIAIQVTNLEPSSWYQDARERAIKHGLSADYHRLIVFFLLPKKPPRPRKIRKSKGSPKIESWDLTDLARRLSEVQTQHPALLNRALEVLQNLLPGYEGHPRSEAIPWHAPLRAKHLFGREPETLAVRQLLAKHQRLAIVGDGGKGKTALAAELLHQLGPPEGCHGPFPRRLFMHNYAINPGHDTALAGLLGQAGQEIKGLSLADMETRVHTLLGEPGTYLYLEGGENASDLPRLLNLVSTSHVLLTSRHETPPPGMAVHELQPLAVLVAAKLMHHVAGAGTSEAPTPAGLDLARFLNGHALACAMAGQVLSHTGWSESKLINDLKSSGLGTPGVKQRDKTGVFYVLNLLWDIVEASHPGSNRVWTVLALGALSPLPVSLLKESTGLPALELAAILDNLRHRGLARSQTIISDDHGGTESHWLLTHAFIKEFALLQGDGPDSLITGLYPRWRDAWLEFFETCWESRKMPGGHSRYEALAPHFASLIAFIASREAPDSILHPLALTYVAVMNHRHGRFPSAEALYRQDFAWCKKQLGAAHPTTLNGVNNLAVMLHSQGDLTGAEPLYRYVAAEQVRTLGTEHPDTLSSLTNVATLLNDQGDLATAGPLFRRVLEIQERTLGPEHPDTLGSLANVAAVLRKSGDLAGAEPLYRRVLEGRERILGPDHPDTLQCLNSLAGLLQKLGDATGAESLCRRSLTARERTLGPGHPGTLASHNQLGVLMESQGQLAQAEACYVKAVLGARTRLPPKDPRRLGYERNLARVQRLTRNQGED